MHTEQASDGIFAVPRVVSIKDCEFYHVMDLPGYGQVGNQWDLRGRIDDYLGHAPLKGKRVLEIGPSSGFVTVEMERRGADVVAVEMADEQRWDFVPYPATVLDEISSPFAKHMHGIRNSFWLTQKVHNTKAKLVYADACNLPDALGRFDIAVMAAILLHARNPLMIIEQCAKRAQTLIITEISDPAIEGMPVCRLMPTSENKSWHTWWNFSSDFLTQFVGILGYRSEISRHQQKFSNGILLDMFTIIARK